MYKSMLYNILYYTDQQLQTVNYTASVLQIILYRCMFYRYIYTPGEYTSCTKMKYNFTRRINLKDLVAFQALSSNIARFHIRMQVYIYIAAIP